MDVIGTRTEGLGDSTYLLTHDGVGLLVDPQRDYERFLDDLGGADLRFVVETHMHNDYVSGGKAASEATGAELVLPAGSGAAFRFTPAFHNEEIDAGPFTIRPLHTPGHTPEHTSYVVVLDGEPVAVFTGGSLLVGSAGRSDLLGMDRARQLSRLQFQSVHRIASLPGAVGLYPTHGEGSFCTASGAGRYTSTIGEELASSPVLKHPDAEAFADDQLGALQPYPTYYRHMGPANVAGPTAVPTATVPALSVDDIAAWDGAVIDIRSRDAFSDGHVPGSICVELSDSFGTWVGWLVDIDTPIALVTDGGQSVDEAVLQLARIGYDTVQGTFSDLDGWLADGRELASYRQVDIGEFRSALSDGSARQVLDVRAPDEFASGSIPGSVHTYLPDLDTSMPDFDTDRPVWVACRTGNRATIAAGILESAGLEPIVLASDGVPDLVG